MDVEINYNITTKCTVKQKALLRNMFVTNQIFEGESIRMFSCNAVTKRTLICTVSVSV